MQAFHTSLPPHKLVRLQSDTAAKWCTVTAALQVWVCPHSCHTVSRILRSTMSLTALLPRLDSFTVCLFSPVSCRNVRHTVQDRLFSCFTCSLIFVSALYSSSIFYITVFFLYLAALHPFLLSAMTAVSFFLGHRLYFIQHFLSFPFAHLLAQAAAQLWQTHAPGPSPCIERNPIPREECGKPRGRPNRGTNQLVIQQIVYLKVILSDT